MSNTTNTNINTISNPNHSIIYNFSFSLIFPQVDNIHIGINIIVTPTIYNDILSIPRFFP